MGDRYQQRSSNAGGDHGPDSDANRQWKAMQHQAASRSQALRVIAAIEQEVMHPETRARLLAGLAETAHEITLDAPCADELQRMNVWYAELEDSAKAARAAAEASEGATAATAAP